MDLLEGRETEDWAYRKTGNRPWRGKNIERVTVRCLDPEARECNFLEVSLGYNEAEAKLAEAEPGA